VVDPDDEGVAAAGDVVGAGEEVAREDLVELEEAGDVAGVEADDRPRLDAVADLLLPVVLVEAVGREVLPVGQEVCLGRVLGGLVG